MSDNLCDPYKISINNNEKKVHIRCLNVDYHDYWITPNGYDKSDYVCRYCNNRGIYGKVHPFDSFGSKYPEIFDIWSINNTKSPYEYSEFSHEYITLKCENGIHDDYKRMVADYSRYP